MARNILILGASYGSLLATKLLMAGHHATLVCRKKTAELINREGTVVRIRLRDEATHRSIPSSDLPGKLDATPPADVALSRSDLVCLAMQEPQYTNHTIRVLMVKIAEARLPCLSIMNMPPLPYLKRIPALAEMDLEEAYTNAQVWERFKPGLVSLCSPDPQAFRITVPTITIGATATKATSGDSGFGVINSITIPETNQSVAKLTAKSNLGTR